MVYKPVGADENGKFPPRVETALHNTVVTGQMNRLPLDIWGGFVAAGTGSGSWNAQTYASWIAGIDARLSGKGVTKAQIGTATDGKAIWAYTFGAVGAPHALMTSGTHGIESLPQFAAMRYFTEFVDNPKMDNMRAQLRLTWVPTLNPSAYLTNRYNSAGVDLNRNWDYYWEHWADTTHPKGAAAMDQPETQAVKTLIDSTKIACVMDLHTVDNTGPHIFWTGPARWTLGNHDIAFNAASRWDQSYNLANTVTHAEYPSMDQGYPLLQNWANKYLVFTKARQNAATLLMETRHDLGGSLSLLSMTDEGARLYCGFIHTYLQEWLLNGQSGVRATPTHSHAARVFTDFTKSLDAGGTKIADGIMRPLVWDTTPTMIPQGNVGRNFVDIPVPGTGYLEINALVMLKVPAEASPLFSDVSGQLAYGPTPVGGGNVALQGDTAGAIQLTKQSGSVTGDRGELALKGFYSVTGPQLVRIQLLLNKVAGTSLGVEVQRARLSATWHPTAGVAARPQVTITT